MKYPSEHLDHEGNKWSVRVQPDGSHVLFTCGGVTLELPRQQPLARNEVGRAFEAALRVVICNGQTWRVRWSGVAFLFEPQTGGPSRWYDPPRGGHGFAKNYGGRWRLNMSEAELCGLLADAHE
jgi:hypothetical protein